MGALLGAAIRFGVLFHLGELRTGGGLSSEIGPSSEKVSGRLLPYLMASEALLRIAAQSYRSSKSFANAAYKICDATFNGVTGRGLPPTNTEHSHNNDLGSLEVATATEDLAYLPCLPFRLPLKSLR